MNIRLIPVALIIVAIASFKPLKLQKSAAIADKFLNDVGIANDPDVLFAEDFNGGIKNIIARYTEVKNGEGMSTDKNDVPEGSLSSALKITNRGRVNDGGHLYKQFKKSFDSVVYVRYYVKYPLSSKGYIHHESVWFGGYNPSTAYPSPKAGICDLGDKRISVAYEPANASAMDTYVYWGDMKPGARGQCYGNDMVNAATEESRLKWDKWMCVETMVKMNNPVSAYNGELKVWQDGKEVGHWGPNFPKGYWNIDSWINTPAGAPFKGFRWRTDEALKVNYLWIEFFDDTSPAGTSHHIKFANLVMAKKYIGPIRKS
ncbi:hypothetical protein ACFQZS_02000 [Mucilaginibacter calamicampi]|uniref:GH16 domain-containing protein n=2 Tax=Mucilaginibacter calamicampi TaxID=1302352 RepID=A0ABW2YS60_9SPHI